MAHPAQQGASAHRFAWPAILCLVGLDYFSTLGYQPSIAFQAAGKLAPLATLLVVAVTLFVALPIYAYVAGRSPDGQGAIGMLERLVPGWHGKFLVLVMLGFAATDYLFTRTLSTADAAVHLVQNPNPRWQGFLDLLFRAGVAAGPLIHHPLWDRAMHLWNRQMVTTLLLLVIGFIFWASFRRGFTRNLIRIAVVVTCVYLVLTGIIIGSGLVYLANHRELIEGWWNDIRQIDSPLRSRLFFGGGSWAMAALACLLAFPKAALGLSGFEMSMVVMPLIRGGRRDEPKQRIRDTRKLLVMASLSMAVLLLGSSLVTSLLIPEQALAPKGAAENRALAFLAHGGGPLVNPYFGPVFGTAYDCVTVLILSLAGASVMIGLRDFVPAYLYRLGMELNWAHAIGAIIHVFNVLKLGLTLAFHADVGSQRGALMTSVLALFAGAAAAVAIDRWPDPSRLRRLPLLAMAATLFFAGVALIIATTRPGGVIIALSTIAATLILSMVSRLIRTTELRFSGFEFVDGQSKLLWQSLQFLEFPVLVPHRPGRRSLIEKEKTIRARHRLGPEVPIVFVEARLGDPSDFCCGPLLAVLQEEGRFIVRIERCASIPHAVAAAALELSKVGKPPEIHFGWSDESPMPANLHFVLFGQGNVPWMVRDLIRRAEPCLERRPSIVIG